MTLFFLVHALSEPLTFTSRATCNSSYAYNRGGTYLSWTNLSESNVYYKVFQSKGNLNNEWTNWGQISTYIKGTFINVLNVYPSQIDGYNGQTNLYTGDYNTSLVNFTFGNDFTQYSLPSSAALKAILEGGTMSTKNSTTIFNPNGVDPRTGEQVIYVTPISINDFESNISVEPNFIYDYDVIFFGSAKYSSGYNILTTTATNVIAEYIKKGYGVFTGYDSIDDNFYIKSNAQSLLAIRDLFGIKVSGADSTVNGGKPSYVGYITNNAKVIQDGLLMNYPYKIGSKGSTIYLNSISASGASTGDVWALFGNTERDEFGLLHGYYLTTNNNTAVIQSGLSNSMPIEGQIIANTIFYLKQRTYDNFIEDHSAQDFEPPVVNISYNEEEYTVMIKGTDVGSLYKYKVEAYSRNNDDLIASTAEVEVEVSSGIKMYKYKITPNNSSTSSELLSQTKNNFIKLTKEQIQNGNYVHVAAVDNAGNIGEIASIKIPIPEPTKSFTKSNTFSKSNSFTESNVFTKSNSFTESNTFSKSNSLFTESNTFSKSSTTNKSNTFNQYDNSLSHTFVSIHSISFTQTIILYSYISKTQMKYSGLSYVYVDSIYYKYTVIIYSKYFVFYSNYFTLFAQNDGDNSKTNIAIAISIPIAVIIIIICGILIMFIIIRRHKQNKSSKENSEIIVPTAGTSENFSLNDKPMIIEEDPFAQDFMEDNHILI
ncbi:DUF5057 domain-containing protein [Histomonas meleagridis]|uniref:DUF5057 domain-containing protein n=1 Tax=Histomonas meleagridis TaxID=135588 RepID=UPI00355A2979|nr:DUF5057 domain-containing protein [Histomonas meleagridis]KAH0799856.1 DUF5057 domain-containing protein [Histomonas meleagridis]